MVKLWNRPSRCLQLASMLVGSAVVRVACLPAVVLTRVRRLVVPVWVVPALVPMFLLNPVTTVRVWALWLSVLPRVIMILPWARLTPLRCPVRAVSLPLRLRILWQLELLMRCPPVVLTVPPARTLAAPRLLSLTLRLPCRVQSPATLVPSPMQAPCPEVSLPSLGTPVSLSPPWVSLKLTRRSPSSAVLVSTSLSSPL